VSHLDDSADDTGRTDRADGAERTDSADRPERVPVADPTVSERARERVDAVLRSGQLADGEPVRAFEREFADYCGAAHGVACANGTAALHAALRACGVGPGDTVVTTPFSFVATANAVRFCGAEPVFADVDPDTLNLDPAAVRDVVEARDGDVDAVLPVHLYGRPAEMDAFLEIAGEYDALLIEDAAQAHGATYRGRPVGSLGDAAAFSFYPTKNVTAGEGGMVTTHRSDVADRVARLADHGRTDGYEHVDVGYNCRMTSLCAAVGRVQLEKATDYVLARRGNAAFLTNRLAGTSVETPPSDGVARPAYNQYTVRHDERDALAAHLDAAGVGTAVYYPTPIHRQPAYADVTASCPVAERAADHVLSLPVHPGLDHSQLERVVRAVTAFDKHNATSEADEQRREA
jgi:dTDP-4-amino-4,6-dideoxygalactose transaminase